MAHTDNVLGFWDLDSDSTDDSGNGNNGTDTSVSYDGTSVSLGGGSIDFSTAIQPAAFTAVIWANESSWPAAYKAIFGNSNGAFSRGWALAIGINDVSDRIGLFVNNYTTGGLAYVATGTLATGSFVHIGMTYDGVNVKLYVSGSQVASNAYSTAIDYSSVTHFGIGILAALSGNFRCAALYSVGKDATWMAEDYNSGTPKKWADWAGGGGYINPQFPLRFAAGIGA